MGSRCAVHTGSIVDIIFGSQKMGDCRIVPAWKIQRKYWCFVGVIAGADDVDAVYLPQLLIEVLTIAAFYRKEFFDALLLDVLNGSQQANEANDVGGASFKFIRHLPWVDLVIGLTAGAAGDEGSKLFGKVCCESHAAGTSWTQQALVAGET